MTNRTFGFEWASELEPEIALHQDEISCMEIIPENFFEGRYGHFLQYLEKTGLPVAVHGVLLSIGSMEPLKTDHLDKVLKIAERVNMVNLSEHLSLTEVQGVDLDALTPLAWTQEVVDQVCRKVEAIQKKIKVPFLLENVSNRFVVPNCEFTETEFINRIIDKTGCGLLLDVTNVYTNSINFDFDPYQWMDEINLRAAQVVHLAGGYKDPDGFLMDSHNAEVEKGSWELYSHVVKRAPEFMTIIERTSDIPPFDSLMNELRRAKNISLETTSCSTQPEGAVDARLDTHGRA